MTTEPATDDGGGGFDDKIKMAPPAPRKRKRPESRSAHGLAFADLRCAAALRCEFIDAHDGGGFDGVRPCSPEAGVPPGFWRCLEAAMVVDVVRHAAFDDAMWRAWQRHDYACDVRAPALRGGGGTAQSCADAPDAKEVRNATGGNVRVCRTSLDANAVKPEFAPSSGGTTTSVVVERCRRAAHACHMTRSAFRHLIATVLCDALLRGAVVSRTQLPASLDHALRHAASRMGLRADALQRRIFPLIPVSRAEDERLEQAIELCVASARFDRYALLRMTRGRGAADDDDEHYGDPADYDDEDGGDDEREGEYGGGDETASDQTEDDLASCVDLMDDGSTRRSRVRPWLFLGAAERIALSDPCDDDDDDDAHGGSRTRRAPRDLHPYTHSMATFAVAALLERDVEVARHGWTARKCYAYMRDALIDRASLMSGAAPDAVRRMTRAVVIASFQTHEDGGGSDDQGGCGGDDGADARLVRDLFAFFSVAPHAVLEHRRRGASSACGMLPPDCRRATFEPCRRIPFEDDAELRQHLAAEYYAYVPVPLPQLGAPRDRCDGVLRATESVQDDGARFHGPVDAFVFERSRVGPLRLHATMNVLRDRFGCFERDADGNSTPLDGSSSSSGRAAGLPATARWRVRFSDTATVLLLDRAYARRITNVYNAYLAGCDRRLVMRRVPFDTTHAHMLHAYAHGGDAGRMAAVRWMLHRFCVGREDERARRTMPATSDDPSVESFALLHLLLARFGSLEALRDALSAPLQDVVRVRDADRRRARRGPSGGRYAIDAYGLREAGVDTIYGALRAFALPNAPHELESRAFDRLYRLFFETPDARLDDGGAPLAQRYPMAAELLERARAAHELERIDRCARLRAAGIDVVRGFSDDRCAVRIDPHMFSASTDDKRAPPAHLALYYACVDPAVPSDLAVAVFMGMGLTPHAVGVRRADAVLRLASATPHGGRVSAAHERASHDAALAHLAALACDAQGVRERRRLAIAQGASLLPPSSDDEGGGGGGGDDGVDAGDVAAMASSAAHAGRAVGGDTGMAALAFVMWSLETMALQPLMPVTAATRCDDERASTCGSDAPRGQAASLLLRRRGDGMDLLPREVLADPARAPAVPLDVDERTGCVLMSDACMPVWRAEALADEDASSTSNGRDVALRDRRPLTACHVDLLPCVLLYPCRAASARAATSAPRADTSPSFS